MRSETCEYLMRRGQDEMAWWDEMVKLSNLYECSIVQFRGRLWSFSQGRAIVYKVAGEDHMVTGFLIARPD